MGTVEGDTETPRPGVLSGLASRSHVWSLLSRSPGQAALATPPPAPAAGRVSP